MKKVLKKIIVFILTIEARAVLFRYRPKIIAITGSVGKTTTKDAIHAVLSKKFFSRKSPKSFNSELGIPLAILGANESGWGSAWKWTRIILKGALLIFYIKKYPEWLVLEVGADHPGDIEQISKWLTPDCVVITRFSKAPVHLEFFPSREALLNEKAFLVRALKKDGLLILDADDKDVYALRDKTNAKVVSFGKNENARFRFLRASILYEKGGMFPIGVDVDTKIKDVTLPPHLSECCSDKVGTHRVQHTERCGGLHIVLNGTIGLHNAYSALAAIAVGVEISVDLPEALNALKEFSFPNGRMKILRGVKETVLIDDSYNSSPVALSVAIEAFKELDVSGRKIVVFGDMLELGEKTAKEHEKAGTSVVGIADFLVTVGKLSYDIYEGARKTGMPKEKIKHFNTSKEAAIFLNDFVKSGDALLVKGSQGVRMEKIVEKLLKEPERAKDLLVRQEEEWQN